MVFNRGWHVHRQLSLPGKQRVFCGTCGSPIYSRRAGLDVLRVRAGSIEAPLAGGLIHCHVSGKCDWWTIREPGPQFREGYEQLRGSQPA